MSLNLHKTLMTPGYYYNTTLCATYILMCVHMSIHYYVRIYIHPYVCIMCAQVWTYVCRYVRAAYKGISFVHM